MTEKPCWFGDFVQLWRWWKKSCQSSIMYRIFYVWFNFKANLGGGGEITDSVKHRVAPSCADSQDHSLRESCSRASRSLYAGTAWFSVTEQRRRNGEHFATAIMWSLWGKAWWNTARTALLIDITFPKKRYNISAVCAFIFTGNFIFREIFILNFSDNCLLCSFSTTTYKCPDQS